MARKHKRTRNQAPIATAEVLPVADSAYNAMGWSGYQGAHLSADRGQVWWPTIDTRLELDSFSRYEILRRIHFLKAHFGYLRGLIRNSADLIGWSSPQGESGDEAWDKEAEEYFRDVTGEAAAFDTAGKFDFHDAQPMLMRAAFTDGQILTVMTKWTDGSPRFAFYEASQLASPKDGGPDWVDGIKIAKGTRRHLAYGLRDSATDEVIVIPARNVIYFGEFDSPGQDMPIPPLAHAVNHALDITEVWGFVKKAIKVASLSGAVIERDGQTPVTRAKQGIVGAPSATVTHSGEKFRHDNVWDGGQIPTLEPGSRMKILNDQRPSPEQRQLVLDLKRDIAEGFGLPVEVIDEMGRMTGPGIRFVMDVAGNWIRCRQKRQKRWARAVWRYVIACGIESGRLRMPTPAPAPTSKGGEPRAKWWSVSFTSQRLLTIDRGKESKARMDELDAGVATYADFEEFDGRDWRDRGIAKIRQTRFYMDECEKAGVPFEVVFRSRAGTAAVAPMPAAGGNSADPDAEIDTEDTEEDAA